MNEKGGRKSPQSLIYIPEFAPCKRCGFCGTHWARPNTWPFWPFHARVGDWWEAVRERFGFRRDLTFLAFAFEKTNRDEIRFGGLNMVD